MRSRPTNTAWPVPDPGTRLVPALGLVLASAAALSAQEPYTPAPTGPAIGANLIFQAFSGEDFETFHDGFGGTITGRYTARSGFQLLGGVHYSIHGVTGGPGDVRFLEVFVDPRYVLELFNSERIVLLVAGRAAFVRQTLSGAALEGGASGLVLGGSMGGIYGLNRRLAVELTLFFGGLWTDGVRAVEGAEKSGNGNVTTLQAGIVWSFPR